MAAKGEGEWSTCSVFQSLHHAKAISVQPCLSETALDAEVVFMPALLRSNEQLLYIPVRYGCHLESKVLAHFELDFSADAAAA